MLNKLYRLAINYNSNSVNGSAMKGSVIKVQMNKGTDV
jgi:hypothetical protein